MYNFFEFCQVLEEGRSPGDPKQYVRPSLHPDYVTSGSDGYQGRGTQHNDRLQNIGAPLDKQVRDRDWAQTKEISPELGVHDDANALLSADAAAQRKATAQIPLTNKIRRGGKAVATLGGHNAPIEGDGKDTYMLKAVNNVVLQHLASKTLSIEDFKRQVKDIYNSTRKLGGTEDIVSHGEALDAAIDDLLKSGKKMGYAVSGLKIGEDGKIASGMVRTPSIGEMTPEGEGEGYEAVASNVSSGQGQLKAATDQVAKELEKVANSFPEDMPPQEIGRQGQVKELVNKLKAIANLSIKHNWDKLNGVEDFFGTGPATASEIIRKLDRFFGAPAVGQQPTAGAQQPKREASWDSEDLWLCMETYQF